MANPFFPATAYELARFQRNLLDEELHYLFAESRRFSDRLIRSGQFSKKGKQLIKEGQSRKEQIATWNSMDRAEQKHMREALRTSHGFAQGTRDVLEAVDLDKDLDAIIAQGPGAVEEIRRGNRGVYRLVWETAILYLSHSDKRHLPTVLDGDVDEGMDIDDEDTMSQTSSQFEAEMEDATSRIIYLKLHAAGD